MPTVSVIVPNFNRAALIGETLSNILAQTRPPDELIVVDDGSTDGSVDAIAGFGRQVRLIRQENRGPAAARNRGLAEAAGEFIQFMDSDDLCSLNKLEVQERQLGETGAPFVYSPWLQARLVDGKALHAGHVVQQRPVPASRSCLSWLLRGWLILLPACLFRRSALDRAGPFREDLPVAEDLELLFRILESGLSPAHCPEPLLLYRIHSSAQISRGGTERLTHARAVRDFVATVADQLGAAPGAARSDVRRWQWRQWEADRELQSADIGHVSPALPPGSRLHLGMDRFARRVRRALARRLGGSSFDRPFQPGRLTAMQAELIRQIGYRPMRVRPEEVDGP